MIVCFSYALLLDPDGLLLIIYNDTCDRFVEQCSSCGGRDIGDVISTRMEMFSMGFSQGSERSWENSLPRLARAMRNHGVPGDANIAIEYRLDPTRYRVDALIYGTDGHGGQVVIIELKQWSTVSRTSKPDFVHTFGGDGEGDYWHPSYQAANYGGILLNFNAFVQDESVGIHSCSFLHNMPEENEILLDDTESFPLVRDAPVFLENDDERLAEFIKRFIKGPCKDLLYRIENSEIRPSPCLSAMLSSSLEGNDFYSYSDEQADAVSTIVDLTRDSSKYGEKRTIIVVGGPGTGKSIVAVNAMGRLISPRKGTGLNAAYFTVNAAPRNYYLKQLTGENYKKSYLKNLLLTPLALVSKPADSYACALLDEAHRMFDWKGGTGVRKGINAVEEAIKASKVTVFFIDRDQAVTVHDYATEDRIREFAEKCGSKIVRRIVLKTQFRVIGGDAYLSFVRRFLDYPDAELSTPVPASYDFRIFDTAFEMREELRARNREFGRSRMVAGYDYEWITKNDRNAGFDIVLDDGRFKARWNNGMAGSDYSWLYDDGSFEDVGCIHTCQGLDMEYCGVIIGRDLRSSDGKLVFDQTVLAKSDRSSGIRTLKDSARAAVLIRNTYNVLLTRGMRGTYVYCEDRDLSERMKDEWRRVQLLD